jgi:hypothetical protein
MRSAFTESLRSSRTLGLGAILAACLLLGMAALGADVATSAAAQADNQCVVCHTDAAKLKALTPPDPPPSEEGEG